MNYRARGVDFWVGGGGGLCERTSVSKIAKFGSMLSRKIQILILLKWQEMHLKLPVVMNLLSYYIHLEQFSIECRKTKVKVITLANHKGRRAIHCSIKTWSNYTKRRKTCASKSRLVLVLLEIGFGFNFDWLRKWREFFKPITERSNAKPM